MNPKSFLWITLFMSISTLLLSQSRIAITHGPYLQGLTENEVPIV